MAQNQNTQNNPKTDNASKQQTQDGRSKETDPNNPTANVNNEDGKRPGMQQQKNEDTMRHKPYSKNVTTDELDEESDDEQTDTENDNDERESPQNEGFSGNQNRTNNNL